MPIQIDHDPDQEHLTKLGVAKWPIWEKEVSEFPWQYEGKETCYVLNGKVTWQGEEKDDKGTIIMENNTLIIEC